MARVRSELAALRAEADRLRAVPVAAVLTAALLLTTLLWAFLQHAEPFLGHDESVYAGRARSLVTGSPAVGWMAYRPVGLPFIGALGLRLGEDTPSLRRVALLLALVTVLVVHAVAARVTTGRRAAVAVLVMVSGATFIRRVPEFLDDIPAAGLLLLTAYLVLRSRRQGGWWALPAAAATGVAAVLIRYGAAAGLITIALAGIAAWGPRVWLRAWRELLAAGTVLATGLAPLALYSIRETGSPIGLLARAEVTAHRAFLGEGLVYYLRAFPAKLAGVVGALVMAAALIGLAADTRRLLRARRDRLTTGHATTGRPTRAGTVAGRDPARERVFLGLAAVGELVLLGLLAHGEGRFALFTVMTLVVLGVDVVARWSGRWRATALAATAVAAVAATGITSVLVYAQMSQSTGNVTAVAGVAAQLRSPAGPLAAARQQAGWAVGPAPTGRACLVITRLAIEAAWASGCHAAEPDGVRALPADAEVYVITFPGSAGWSGEARIRHLDPRRSWTPAKVSSDGQLGDAVVLTSPPPAAVPGS